MPFFSADENMKKIASIFLLFFSVLMVFVSPVTAITVVSIGDVSALPNEYTTVPIMVSSVSNLG